jgi:hypothetical protein
MIEIVLLPGLRGMLWLGVPDVRSAPLTLTVAVDAVSVGMTVIEVMGFATIAEYVRLFVVKLGLSVPELRVSADSEATLEKRVTATV